MIRYAAALGILALACSGASRSDPEARREMPVDPLAARTIEFTVVGGIAGFDMTLEIAGGVATLTSAGGDGQPVRAPLDARVQAELADQLATAAPTEDVLEFGASSDPVADAMLRRLRVVAPERSWSVTDFGRGGEPLPESFRPLFDLLMTESMALRSQRHPPRRER